MEAHLLYVSSLTPSGSHCAGLFSTSVLGGSSSAPNLQDYARTHRKKLTSSGCIDGMCAHAHTDSHLHPRTRSRVASLRSQSEAGLPRSPSASHTPAGGSWDPRWGSGSVGHEQLHREYTYSKCFVRREIKASLLFQLKENLDYEE